MATLELGWEVANLAGTILDGDPPVYLQDLLLEATAGSEGL
jgi:hypothetical protein